MNLILAIDTSCDETSASVTDGRKVLSNVISSQIDIHKKYGGVYPALAKRAHEEKIDYVIKKALRRACFVIARRRNDDEAIPNNKERLLLPMLHRDRNDKGIVFNLPLEAVAVTQGPGLAIALEVGIRKAKELVTLPSLPTPDSQHFDSAQCMTTSHPHPKLIAVNHLEGHIYACLADNSKGLPNITVIPSLSNGFGRNDILFPALCLIVSGGHTLLALMKDHGVYEMLGETLDDACGEALDKAAKILKLGYPGGPIIERLAEKYLASKGDAFRGYIFKQPLPQKSNLNFSYSGLKTQFLYLVQSLSEKEFSENLRSLAFSFQAACFEQIIRKTSQAIKQYQPKTILCGGGVISNKNLRKQLRHLAKENQIPVLFPPKKNLITDNAAMIGIAAYYKMLRGEFVKNPEDLDRQPRMAL